VENGSCEVIMGPTDLAPCSQMSSIDLCIRSIILVYIFNPYPANVENMVSP